MNKPKFVYNYKKNHSPQKIDQYQIIQKIAEGTFGQIFKVFDTNTSELKVLKKNKQMTAKTLKREASIMQQMSGSDGFAQLANEAQSPYMIMTYLGLSLSTILSRTSLSLYSLKRISYQLIDRLQQLHKHNFIHQDLKPENILMGNSIHPHRVYLIDFGLSACGTKSTKPRVMYNGITGTLNYCSIAAHKGYQQFPKDDLESLGYVLAQMYTRSLPWKDIKEKSDDKKYPIILSAKQAATAKDLSGGVNSLRRYLEHIKKLKPEDKIDYNQLREYFGTNAKKQYCYEFCNKCKYRLQSKDQQPPNNESHAAQMHQLVLKLQKCLSSSK